MAVRQQRTAARAIEYRAGVHLAGTVIWCDALHAREVCFVSSARARGSRRHRQTIATARTAALLGLTGALVTPYARPFALGRARLELFPSGASLGAASLQVDHAGRRLIYAGEVAVRPAALCEPGELRRCDVLVLAAQVTRTLPPPDAVAGELAAYLSRALAAEETPVVVVAPHGDAEAAVVALAARGFELCAHAQLAGALTRWRAAGAELPPVPRLRRPRPGQVVLWPPPAPTSPRRRSAPARGLAETLAEHGLPRPRIALLEAGPPTPAPCVESFAWSSSADPAELAGYALATGARELYLTGRAAEVVAAGFRARGLDAHVLGPPQQMSLF